jgi:acyl carrier protein
MATNAEIRGKVKQFVARELARDRAGDLESESLVESGIIDSVGIMKLVDFLEKELRVKITDDELLPENFDTLDAIAALVAPKVSPP